MFFPLHYFKTLNVILSLFPPKVLPRSEGAESPQLQPSGAQGLLRLNVWPRRGRCAEVSQRVGEREECLLSMNSISY